MNGTNPSQPRDEPEIAPQSGPRHELTVSIDIHAFARQLAALVSKHLAETLPVAASPWLDVDGAATYLSCSVERIRKLITRREIPFHQARPGGRVFLNRHELDEWLLNQ